MNARRNWLSAGEKGLCGDDSGHLKARTDGHQHHRMMLVIWEKPNDESRLRVMVALLALVLILAIFGGLGFAVHILWVLLIIAVLIWLIGFFVGGVEGGGRRWYGRW